MSLSSHHCCAYSGNIGTNPYSFMISFILSSGEVGNIPTTHHRPPRAHKSKSVAGRAIGGIQSPDSTSKAFRRVEAGSTQLRGEHQNIGRKELWVTHEDRCDESKSWNNPLCETPHVRRLTWCMGLRRPHALGIPQRLPKREHSKTKQQRAVAVAARHMFTFIAIQSECFIVL